MMETVFTSEAGTLRFDTLHAPPGSLSALINGDILVWKGGLQQLGLLHDYKNGLLDGVSEIASDAVRAAIEREGVEYLHRHLSIPDLLRLDKLLIRRFSACARSFFNRFFEAGAAPREAQYYIAEQAWVRLIAPENCLTPHLSLVKDELGHLVAHNPHRDSWFSQAGNVINFWIALGRVRSGNSVLIYPESYGRELATEDLRLSKDQALAPPMSFHMDEGDILLFHGDHLHSSELNITDETRVVLSFRLTCGRPEYAHANHHFEYQPL